MSFDLIGLVGLAAVIVMLVNLVMAIVLKSQLSGGMVGRRWNILIPLVVTFMGGYLMLPFIGRMPIETPCGRSCRSSSWAARSTCSSRSA